MLKGRSFKRLDLALLCFVLLLAGAVRMGRIGVVSYQYDEALISQNVLDMLQHHHLPLTGQPTSVGIPASPMSLYVLALPFAVSSNPLLATLFIAFFNTLGVGLLFLLAQRYISRTVALAAGTIYAVNPWAILFSRKIWEPNLFSPFLIAAVLLGLYGYLEQPTEQNRRWHRWAQVVFWPILLIGIQIHFSVWTLLPLFVLIVGLGYRQIHYRSALIGFLLGIAFLVPFAVGLAKSYHDNPLPFTEFGKDDSSAFKLEATAWHYVVDEATGRSFISVVNFPPEVKASLWMLDDLWQVVGLAILLGIAGLLVRPWRLLTIIAILWAGLPLVIFTPNWTDLASHYFISTIPGFSLLAGIGIGVLPELVHRLLARFAWKKQVHLVLRLSMTGLLLTALLPQALWWFQVINKIDQVHTEGEMSLPLYRLVDIADKLSGYKSVVLVSNNYWQSYNKEPQVWRVLLRDRVSCLRAIGPDSFAVFPAGSFAVLTTPNAGENPVQNRYLTADQQQITLREGEGHYTIDTFASSLSWSGPALTDISPVTFDNGIQLTGYRLEQDRMYLRWTILQSGGKNFQYTGQFLNAAGDRIGQRDTTFVPGTYRCAGDQVVTWIDISLPADIVTLRVGMYNLWLDRSEGPLFPANVLDANGQAIGQFIDIPVTG